MMSILDQLEQRLAAHEGKPAPEPVPEEPEEEGAPEKETAEPEEGSEPEGDETPEEITSLKDFATAAGWEPEDLYKLNLKLDTGEEVPLGEIKDRLQTMTRERQAVQEQTQRLNEYAQQVQAQAAEYFQARQADGAEAQAAREAMLMTEARYNSVDWPQLEKVDPGRAALLQQQLAVEYAGAKAQLANAQAKEADMAAQYVQQARQQHAQQLLQAVPEWREPDKVKAEFPQVQQYLGQWFSPAELETVYDWRAQMLARKAWLYDQGQTKMKDIEQKVKSAPKPVLKPGTGQPRGAALASKEAAMIKKARESGRREDKDRAASMILTRALGGGRR